MDIIGKAINIRNYLRDNCDDEKNRIDVSVNKLGIIPPFIGKGKIKLIIIGQDPTIRNVKQRSKITCTLNLDKNGSLKTYIEDICAKLGCTIDNVYATNIFKYFYSQPPADILDVLFSHLDKNLELLKKEIEDYPDAKIIALGQPVLRLLTYPKNEVKKYWGFYNKGDKCYSINNRLDRDFFPFIHIGSKSKEFYNDNFDNHIKEIKNLQKSV